MPNSRAANQDPGGKRASSGSGPAGVFMLTLEAGGGARVGREGGWLTGRGRAAGTGAAAAGCEAGRLALALGVAPEADSGDPGSRLPGGNVGGSAVCRSFSSPSARIL